MHYHTPPPRPFTEHVSTTLVLTSQEHADIEKALDQAINDLHKYSPSPARYEALLLSLLDTLRGTVR